MPDGRWLERRRAGEILGRACGQVPLYLFLISRTGGTRLSWFRLNPPRFPSGLPWPNEGSMLILSHQSINHSSIALIADPFICGPSPFVRTRLSPFTHPATTRIFPYIHLIYAKLFPTSRELDSLVFPLTSSLCLRPRKELIILYFYLFLYYISTGEGAVLRVFVIYFYINFPPRKDLIPLYLIYLYLILF